MFFVHPNLHLRSRYASEELAWQDIENKGDRDTPYVVLFVGYSTKYADDYNIKGI